MYHMRPEKELGGIGSWAFGVGRIKTWEHGSREQRNRELDHSESRKSKRSGAQPLRKLGVRSSRSQELQHSGVGSSRSRRSRVRGADTQELQKRFLLTAVISDPLTVTPNNDYEARKRFLITVVP